MIYGLAKKISQAQNKYENYSDDNKAKKPALIILILLILLLIIMLIVFIYAIILTLRCQKRGKISSTLTVILIIGMFLPFVGLPIQIGMLIYGLNSCS